jgi:hypothetical protein
MTSTTMVTQLASRRFTHFSTGLALALAGLRAGAAAPAPTPAAAGLVRAYGRLPLSFEANQGQTDPGVRFLSRGLGHTLFLTST